MSVSRGKQFEEQIRHAFEKVPNTNVIRLFDPQGGFTGIKNPCDFIIYHYPYQYMIECKSCYGKSIPYTNITEYQYSSLVNMDKLEGINAGVIIWFIDRDLTIYMSGSALKKYRDLGYKSLNVDKIDVNDYIIIDGTKKRVLFDYDMTNFLK